MNRPNTLLARVLERAIAPAYRDEVIADLVEDHAKAIAAGRGAHASRWRLYRRLARSAFDSRWHSRKDSGSLSPNFWRKTPGILSHCRRIPGVTLAGAGRDISVAWRHIRSRPLFGAAAVLTLALAIGINAVIFSVLHAVLLRPLPLTRPDGLAFVWNVEIGSGRRDALAPARGLDFRSQVQAIEQLALLGHLQMTVTGERPAERWAGASVSRNFFEVLGVGAAVGRTFSPGPAADDEVVLTDGLWRRDFAASSDIVGRVLVMNDRPRVVVGVLAPDFYWPAITAEVSLTVPPQFFASADATDVPERPGAGGRSNVVGNRSLTYLRAVARLRPGVNLGEARAELATVAARLAREYPASDGGRTATLVPADEQFFGHVQRPLWLLYAATIVIVVLAALNVANLFLIRLAGRGRELAVRVALGATRARVLRLLTIEGLCLAFAGGVVGVGLALVGVGWFAAIAPETVGRVETAALHPSVLLMNAAMSIVAGLVLGILPGLAVTRRQSITDLRGAGVAPVQGSRTRHALVAGQVAASIVLLVAAVLFTTSLARLRRVDVGFDPRGLLTFDVSLTGPQAATPVPYFDELLRRLRTVPGVKTAAAAVTLPIGGDDFGARVRVEGEPEPAPGSDIRVGYQIVSPGWFQTLGLGLLVGRDFTPADDGQRGRVVIVSERFAQSHWPKRDAIGRRLRTGRSETAPWMTVVGVVSSVRHGGPRSAAREEIYEPYYQSSLSFMAVAIRSDRDPAALADDVRAEVRRFDRSQPISGMSTMERHLARAYGDAKFLSVLTSLFAALAAALAAVGVYGVVGSSVSQRLPEFGIRAALGASRRSLQALVVRQGLRPVFTGAAVGILASMAVGRAASGLLFETTTNDPRLYLIALGVLSVAAALALWIPAVRAARVDPIKTLKST